jgi:hypothetical protein
MTELESGLFEAIHLRLLDNPALKDMRVVELHRATGGGFTVLGHIRGDNWGCWLTDIENPAALCSGVYGSEDDCRAMLSKRKRKTGVKCESA